MDFEIPDEIVQLLAVVKKFREKELMPLEHHRRT